MEKLFLRAHTNAICRSSPIHQIRQYPSYQPLSLFYWTDSQIILIINFYRMKTVMYPRQAQVNLFSTKGDLNFLISQMVRWIG